MPEIVDRQKTVLQEIAHRVMLERGLLPDFPQQVIAETGRISGPATNTGNSLRDMRVLPWSSIDNDSSRDLDQLTYAEKISDGGIKIFVAIADVDALVKKQSALDLHAQHNTTSIYSVAEIFPMLPEKLSTDLTSLNPDSDRVSVVIEMSLSENGSLRSSEIYRAFVRNHAKLAYNSVALWLEGTGPMPAKIGDVKGLEENIRLQDSAAQKMKSLRQELGALDLETGEIRPRYENGKFNDMEAEKRNRAKELIEDFMIAANGCSARFLASRKLPSIRRVVRTPKRWERIVELASEKGCRLPSEPDSKALENFLISAKSADPLRFPDLSLTIIKLLGPGEYVVEIPGTAAEGHFALAVKDYTHTTAPNRRYPDIITHRLLKSVLSGSSLPYSNEELDFLAKRCTDKENAAKKVERQVAKSAVAMLLENRIGERFDAIVTGASDKGTWVRILHPAVEGRLASGFQGVDVGQRIRIQLTYTNVERGFIDFKRCS
ncbi:MAG TPA: ribonuclease II [Lentisphaeria bacterium]|nr:MAG: ribonuclease II [Lentisphaerae bacterium GWF2_49_21]HBC86713.1 ribonuclease II [Lentisphaeria bacterium]